MGGAAAYLRLRCGMGHRVRETVLGTLGKATILRIPPELRDLTVHFGAAMWKRDTEDPLRKLVLLKYSDSNYTNYMEGRTRFHASDFSLEILNTSRQDRQLYEYIVSKGSEEKVWQIQLEVYEPVSDLSIQILSWAQTNGSCTVTLNCTAARGDNVSYSWGSRDASTSGLCTRNSSLLHLSYPLQNASIACACTASNPISSWVVDFNSSQCSYEQGGSAEMTTEHLVLAVVVPIATVMMFTGAFVVAYLVMEDFLAARSAEMTTEHLVLAVVVPIATVMMFTGAFVVAYLVMPGASREQEHSPLAEDNAVHTIYSQVQRVE
ncbi:PREDICTED: signaling lymphocytic activation molecule, partial [Pterocles gutturalis]|uniref:signaling lymphocytic activation molecule n=1 Tax=Pterocles gutturalis TaxID=240206 RepID=UPI0005290C5C